MCGAGGRWAPALRFPWQRRGLLSSSGPAWQRLLKFRENLGSRTLITLCTSSRLYSREEQDPPARKPRPEPQVDQARALGPDLPADTHQGERVLGRFARELPPTLPLVPLYQQLLKTYSSRVSDSLSLEQNTEEFETFRFSNVSSKIYAVRMVFVQDLGKLWSAQSNLDCYF